METKRRGFGRFARSGLRAITIVALIATAVVPGPVGAQEMVTPACLDGTDNDGDGFVDFPEDPQCAQGPFDPEGLSSDNSEETDGYQEPEFPDGGDGESPAPTCPTTSGPVTLSSVMVNTGGGWQDASSTLCWFFEYTEIPDPEGGITRYVFVSFTDMELNQDISSVYPTGTELSFQVTSSGPAPIFFVGAANDPLAQMSGSTLTLQGRTAAVRFAFESGPDGPNCAGTVQTLSSFFGGLVMLEPAGGVSESLRAYSGGYFGTNAQQTTLPVVGSDGQTVEVSMSGCGDGNPATEEGFFKGFLPLNSLTQAGLTEQVAETLAAVDEETVDDLGMVEVEDNGEPAPEADIEFASEEEVALDPGTGAERAVSASADDGSVAGIFIDYRTSFSTHVLTTVINEKAIAKANRSVKGCKQARGKLRLKNGKLICVKRTKK